jgi:thymidylate synthase
MREPAIETKPKNESNMESQYHADDTYLNLMRQILETGVKKTDRTGTGTRAIFGAQMRFPLAAGFPLLTTKKIHLRSVIAELLWFISGDTNVRTLQAQNVTIWDEWAPEDGDLGPIYGKQWRRWQSPRGGEIDQLRDALRLIVEKPDSRRNIVCAWNPADIEYMALPPCHCLFQFDVLGGKLHCQLYQRSADYFLGVPFNIASYAILLHLVGRHCNVEVGDFVWTGGDIHLYSNHLDQAALQLSRQGEKRPMPTLRFTEDAPTDLFEVRPEHLVIEGYNPLPAIKADIAV